MPDDLLSNIVTDMILELADRRGDTFIREGVEIIRKVDNLRTNLGEKLSKAPHENYHVILRHLEAIEDLFKSEV